MVWNPTATTLTWPPVSRSQSGARRWSGSATWGPLKVRMLTLTPLNLSPWGGADVAGAEAGAEGEAAAVAATVGALVGGGETVGVAAPHPAITTTSAIEAAVDLNRDTAS